MRFYDNEGFMPKVLANDPERLIIVELCNGDYYEGEAHSFVWQLRDDGDDLVAWAYSHANVNGDLIQ